MKKIKAERGIAYWHKVIPQLILKYIIGSLDTYFTYNKKVVQETITFVKQLMHVTRVFSSSVTSRGTIT
jgi:hypothetical protein